LPNRIAQFAYLRYNQIGKEVREKIDRHELSMMDMVAQADAEAMKMASTSDREDYLTNFSVHQANQLFVKWKTLDEYLLVKYIDGNIKRQNEDGSFKNNGHVKHVPPAPIYGGYSDTYKKAVAKEQKQ
jgi:hypothetical protein